LGNYFDIKFRLFDEHGVNMDWLESIPFYEYQIFLDKLNDSIEKENAEIQAGEGVKQLFSFTR
jgi:hypothetical protein